MGILAPLSQLLSTREDGLLMMVSVLAEYPLALLTRTWLYKQPQKVQHIVYATIGIALYLFNYGFAIYHSLLSTLLAYVIVNYFCEHYRCVVMAHACFLGHLMLAYWFAETDQYDINWTTPFCVMVLRYIGLVMDCYDGNKPADKLGSTEKKYAIKSPPDLLEVAAYGFFYAGTLVGPQFSLSRFRSFVNGEFLNEKGEVRDSGLLESLNRFIAGVFFTVVYMWGIVWISNDFFNTNDFYSMSLCWKTIWIVMWYRITMCRYLSAWLLSEGAAILAGLAYNGKDEKGNDLWDGVRDVRILRFWFGYSFQMQVSSFNCGTNNWAKRHIFKRLRWLGDKRISHIVTMTYLAVWHGYHLGYFMIFGLEFFSVLAVSQVI
ncbi:hypothetical protein AB6A40_008491 [Gnathostoma spinigerum]|uniref:Lysophospholipid acyltransferase 5 n=1 Tax=Gnathostoma spinigerum TaxID=75299 RepID=A0ABD6EYK6_9BILA